MKKPKVVIYDNDGMITCGSRFSERFSKEFGINIEIMNPFFEGPFMKCLHGKADLKEELTNVLKEWKWNGTVDEILEYWFDIGIELNEDVYTSITQLREQGIIVCLATNQEKYRTDFLIKRFKYDQIFNEIFSSADLGCYKNSEEGLRITFDKLREKYGGIEREEIMYWDDREGNVAHLNQAGFNGQKYTDFTSFKRTLNNVGILLN